MLTLVLLLASVPGGHPIVSFPEAKPAVKHDVPAKTPTAVRPSLPSVLPAKSQPAAEGRTPLFKGGLRSRVGRCFGRS